MEKEEIDILFIMESENISILPMEKIKTLFVLSEEFSDSRHGFIAIKKYISMREIQNLIWKNIPKEEAFQNLSFGRKAKLMIVYSPVKRCCKTTFAITTGLYLAREQRTLYINMETFSALSNFIKIPNERDLSDLIYYHKEIPIKF